MNMDVLSYVFGIVLLFIAIVGGGFEVRELKVPRVGRVARAVSGVTGVLFLLIGFAVSGAASPNPSPTPAPATTAAASNGGTASPIHLAVQDQLGEGQITEQIAVHIDGRMVGTLTVDEVNPSSTLTVTLPKAGQYDYSLDSTTVFDHSEGPIEVPGHGAGTLDARDGAALSVNYEDGGDHLVLYLE
jgi:hypothetical protein